MTDEYKALITKVTSGAEWAFNISGPGTLTFLPDGSVELLASGKLTEALGTNRTPTQLRVADNVTDVCAALSRRVLLVRTEPVAVSTRE